MKVIFAAFLALAVGAHAFPQDYEIENREPRIIEGQIRRAFEDISNAIRENGLDPAQILNYELRTTVQPGITLWTQIKDFNMIGVSNFDLGRVSYSALSGRLIIEWGLPRVSVSIGSAAVEVDYHGDKYDGVISGSLVLTGLRADVEMRVNVGIISGISIRSCTISLRAPRIESALRLTTQGTDHSDELNNFLNVRLPRWLVQNKVAIESALSELVKDLLNELLN